MQVLRSLPSVNPDALPPIELATDYDRRLPTIHCYVRCSHVDSVESGYGLENQERECLRTAARLIERFGHHNVVVYRDKAVSAFRGRKSSFAQRPEGAALLANLRRGDRVVFLRVERAFRRVVDCVSQARAWEELGVTMHVCDGDIDTSSPHGWYILATLATGAEFESRMKSIRIREALARKRAALDQIGKPERPPLGQEFNESGTLTTDRRQLALMRLIRILKDQVRWNYKKISRKISNAAALGKLRLPLTVAFEHEEYEVNRVSRNRCEQLYLAAETCLPHLYARESSAAIDGGQAPGPAAQTATPARSPQGSLAE